MKKGKKIQKIKKKSEGMDIRETGQNSNLHLNVKSLKCLELKKISNIKLLKFWIIRLTIMLTKKFVFINVNLVSRFFKR